MSPGAQVAAASEIPFPSLMPLFPASGADASAVRAVLERGRNGVPGLRQETLQKQDLLQGVACWKSTGLRGSRRGSRRQRRLRPARLPQQTLSQSRPEPAHKVRKRSYSASRFLSEKVASTYGPRLLVVGLRYLRARSSLRIQQLFKAHVP